VTFFGDVTEMTS